MISILKIEAKRRSSLLLLYTAVSLSGISAYNIRMKQETSFRKTERWPRLNAADTPTAGLYDNKNKIPAPCVCSRIHYFVVLYVPAQAIFMHAQPHTHNTNKTLSVVGGFHLPLVDRCIRVGRQYEGHAHTNTNNQQQISPPQTRSTTSELYIYSREYLLYACFASFTVHPAPPQRW